MCKFYHQQTKSQQWRHKKRETQEQREETHLCVVCSLSSCCLNLRTSCPINCNNKWRNNTNKKENIAWIISSFSELLLGVMMMRRRKLCMQPKKFYGIQRNFTKKEKRRRVKKLNVESSVATKVIIHGKNFCNQIGEPKILQSWGTLKVVLTSELLLLLVPVCAPSGHLLYRSRISCILLKRYHHQQTSQKSQSQLRELLDPEKKKKIRFRETKKIQRRRRRRRCRETDLLARTWKSLTLIATDQLEAVEKKIRKITNPGPHTYRYKDLSLNATEEPHEEVCSFWHRNKT